VLLTSARNIVIALVTLAALCVAQDKPAAPQKNAKDQAEADLINSVAKEANAATRLATLQKWAKDYPQTEFAAERRYSFLVTYQQLNKPREAFEAAQEVLKDDSNNVGALSAILSYAYQPNVSPADLQISERIAKYMLANLDTIYAPEKIPQGMNAADWAAVKPQVKPFAQRTLGFIYMTLKDNEKAEVELTKAVELDPTSAYASFWLAQVIFAQRNGHPEKQVPALFEYARAVSIEGPGTLDPNMKTAVRKTLGSYYKQYHGSDEGLDKVLAAAKDSPLPPAGFTIVDIGTIKHDLLVAQEKERQANPAMAFWGDNKKALTGEGGDAYFAEHVKDTALPFPIKGKLISMKPALRPKEIVLAVEKPDVPDFTVKLDEGQVLPGKMEPGADIEVKEGVGAAYTKDPFMLTVTVDKAKISGWVPVKVTPPANPKGKSGSKKGL
jgi:tetratricopeptide (TPR) repeat protein